jgi:hypothetical protein
MRALVDRDYRAEFADTLHDREIYKRVLRGALKLETAKATAAGPAPITAA